MNPIKLILIMLSIGTANAGFYSDIGFGWIDPVTIKTSTEVTVIPLLPSIRVENEVEMPVNSAFSLISLGYEGNNYHVELNRFGVLDDRKKSITTIRFYKRFEF